MNENTNSETEHLSGLLKISSTLSSSLDLKVVLQNAMDLVVDLLKAERGCIMLGEEGNLELKAHRVFDPDLIKSGEEISHGVIEQVFRNNEPVLTVNAMDDQRFAERESVIVYKLRSVMCVPLQTKGKAIGIIYLDNRWKTGIFSQRDLETLVTFANHAGIAIENAKLYENLKLSIDEKLRLQEEIFEEKTKSTVERERYKLREELVHHIVHDLRNPLTVVNLAFSLLETYLPENHDKHTAKMIQKAKSNIKLLSRMLSDMLDVYRLENNQLKLSYSNVKICELFEKLYDLHEPQCKPEINLKFKNATNIETIYVDEDILVRILNNLIQNAIYWTKSGYIEILLEKEVYEEEKYIAIHVIDTGLGIPIDYREKVFSKFVRVERTGQSKSSKGLGLAFCRLAVEAHHGDIKAFENPDGGTIIRIRIPVKPHEN